MLGVALHEPAASAETARGLREQRFGEIHPEAAPRGDLRQNVAGAAPDLEHAIAGRAMRSAKIRRMRLFSM